MKNKFAVGLGKMKSGVKEKYSLKKKKSCRINWEKALKGLRKKNKV